MIAAINNDMQEITIAKEPYNGNSMPRLYSTP
jgi:hypothetical protein